MPGKSSSERGHEKVRAVYMEEASLLSPCHGPWDSGSGWDMLLKDEFPIYPHLSCSLAQAAEGDTHLP